MGDINLLKLKSTHYNYSAEVTMIVNYKTINNQIWDSNLKELQNQVLLLDDNNLWTQRVPIRTRGGHCDFRLQDHPHSNIGSLGFVEDKD